MSIIHKRITGKTGIDPDKVTGKDWDDPHVYGPGSIVPVINFSYSSRSGFSFSNGAQPQWVGDHWMVNVATGLDVADGHGLTYSVLWSPCLLPLPDGVSILITPITEYRGTVNFYFYQDGQPIEHLPDAGLSDGFFINGIVFARVT
ncbi:hypothetical protein [Azonexus sp.]|jgi:hypothetical protein|uniref:hypothetical protein n=1 Tax=Azonexus sp. TaxID=1872668 RepID=UPI0028311CF8|nr:hypothetical protein [Azonexus sp.]MDR1995156.1 hypothetical protein [Azonexus sp.]